MEPNALFHYFINDMYFVSPKYRGWGHGVGSMQKRLESLYVHKQIYTRTDPGTYLHVPRYEHIP